MLNQSDHRAPAARRHGLILATALAGGCLLAPAAQAQDASQLASIQKQIGALQAQLRRLQHEAAARDAALKTAEIDAAEARADAAQAVSRTASYAAASRGAPLSAPPGYYAPPPAPGYTLSAPNPAATSMAGPSPASITQTSALSNKPVIRVGNLDIKLGGFLDATAIDRSASLTAGSSTSYNSIPFNNSVNAHIGEFRMTSQYSRFSAAVTGDVSDNFSVAGYVEGDFAGAATTANSTQTNSYTPRLRQAYTSITDKLDGLNLVVGQTYSMATADKVGITAGQESLPIVVDGNYFPGWIYLRQTQVRLVKTLTPNYAVGFSLEEPQETYAFAGATIATSAPNFKLPNGASVSYENLGGSFLNSTADYSYDTAPDMIAKAAADYPFGHFEVYGLGRFFRTRVTPTSADGQTYTSFGGGVGGSAVIKVIPKKLELVGDVLAGDGIGRYTSGQLPDATFDAEGRPSLLRQISGMVGLVGHPTPLIDLYAYAGVDTDGGSTFSTSVTSKGKTTVTGYGYGTPYASNAGCDTELGSCSAQTRALDDLSLGGWWKVAHGDYGTVQVGVEYSFVKRIAFSGIGGRPTGDENIGYVTVRFLPFQ